MMFDHQIKNVEKLHTDSLYLYTDVVVGIADGIISGSQHCASCIIIAGSCTLYLGFIFLAGQIGLVERCMPEIGANDLHIVQVAVFQCHKGIPHIQCRGITAAGHFKAVAVEGIAVFHSNRTKAGIV